MYADIAFIPSVRISVCEVTGSEGDKTDVPLLLRDRHRSHGRVSDFVLRHWIWRQRKERHGGTYYRRER